MYVDYPVEKGGSFPGTALDQFENSTRLCQVVLEDADNHSKGDREKELHIAVQAIVLPNACQAPRPDEKREDNDKRERYYVD